MNIFEGAIVCDITKYKSR